MEWLECREACIPGKAELSLALPVRAEAPAPSATAGRFAEARRLTLPLALAFAFLGGLVLNLMPCVLPVLSLKVLAFVSWPRWWPSSGSSGSRRA